MIRKKDPLVNQNQDFSIVEQNENTTVGLHQMNAESLGLELYPNPTTGKVTVNYNLTGIDNVLLNVLDITGRSIASRKLAPGNNMSVNLDLDEFPAGIYSVVVFFNNQIQKVEKLMIVK